MADIVQDYKKMFGCPLYIHKTKKACFVRLRGYPYAPIHFDAPICLDAPCMFDAPYIWMPLMFGWLPVSLDAPICPLYVWNPLLGCPLCLDDVWMALYIHNTQKAYFVRLGVSICPHTFGCPLYINNTNKACFVRLRVVHMPPYIWMPTVCIDAAICLDAPPVCLNVLICLDAPICLDGPLYVWMSQCLDTPHMFGYHLYVWTPPYI